MDLCVMADAGPVKMSKAVTGTDRARDAALRWFGELRDPLRRYLVCSGARPADADEAVQESFLRLCRHLEKNLEVENVRAWIYQVARII
jgi:RNA polymerase sigma-70 factor (ECF subfamily)